MISSRWRGFSKNTLLRALFSGVVISTLLVSLEWLPVDRWPGYFSLLQAWSGCTLILFLLLFIIHGGIHYTFKVLHDRGQQAFDSGDFKRAVRLLRLFAWNGNGHYDESGDAHRTLLASLLHLRMEQEAQRITKRCEKLGFETDLESKD